MNLVEGISSENGVAAAGSLLPARGVGIRAPAVTAVWWEWREALPLMLAGAAAQQSVECILSACVLAAR